MTDVLLSRVKCDSGEVFVVKGGCRYLLATCTPVIEIREKRVDVAVIGKVGYKVKQRYAVIVFCDKDGTVYHADVDLSFFSDVRDYELSLEVPCKGRLDAAEMVRLKGVYPTSVRLGEDWTFEITDYNDVNRIIDICGKGD